MRRLHHWLAIRWRLKFDPAGLFHRISNLDWYRDALLDWVDSIGIGSDMRLLEVGCATGMLSKHLSQTASVMGIDRSAAMIAIARQSNAGGRNHFITGDATALPFAVRQFNCALAASLINVVAAPQRALAEMQRVVVKGRLVSALVPDATMADHKVRALIASLGIRGFSREALWAWHRLALKISADNLHTWFNAAGIGEHKVRPHLHGMLISIKGYTP